MNRSFIRNRSVAVTVGLGLVSVLAVGALVLYPARAFEASLSGLQFWWNVVFPALLPYVILVRLAAHGGLYRFAGRLLEPLARLAGWPAGAGEPLAAGLLMGGSAGPAHVVRARARLSAADAAGLAAASGTANPALLFLVLAVALLGSPGVGLLLLAVHLASWLLVLLLVSVFTRKKQAARARLTRAAKPPDPPDEAARPSFGRMLGDSVTEALQALLELGGVIILFAVFARLLSLAGIPGLAAEVLAFLGWREAGAWVAPLMAGLLELNNGIRAVAQGAASAPGLALSLLGALLAWGGLAIHLEVRSLLRKAGIRYGPYLLFRLAHAGAAGCLTAALWPHVRHRLLPWPAGEPAAAGAAPEPTFWPALHGMPQAAWYAAALALLLLVLRLVSRAR